MRALAGVILLLVACGPRAAEQPPPQAQPQPQPYAQPQYAQPQPQPYAQPQYGQQPQPYAQQTYAPPAAPSGFRTIQGAGWSFSVPGHWEEVAAEAPVNISVRDPQAFQGYFHINANLVQEPYNGGDGVAYAQANVQTMQMAAQIMAMVPAQAGAQRAMDIEAAWPNLNPPIRTVQRFAARQGSGYVLTCSGPIQMFEPARPTCNQILASFWVAP